MNIPETRDLFYPGDHYPIEIPGGVAQRIGKDLEAEILVLASGEVVAWFDDQLHPINQWVEQYAKSLELVGRLRNDLAVDAIEDEDGAIEVLEATLRQVDPGAVSDPSRYWTSVVEQLRYELF